jgi:hypothetical protein
MNNILYAICKFMIHLHTRFHMSSSIGSLLTVVTLKVKRNFHMAAMLFLHSRKVPQKVAYCLKIYYHTHLHDSVSSSASVGPTSLVRASAMLLLLIIIN